MRASVSVAGTCRVLFYPGKIFLPRGGVHDKPVAPLTQEVDDEIVYHATIVIEHAAIECLARLLEPGNIIGKDSLQEAGGIDAAHIDYGHMRYIEHAGI